MAEFEMKHILAAVDLGPQSADVLSWTLWFGKQFASNVKVVHAMPLGFLPDFHSAQGGPPAARVVTEKRAEVARKIRQLSQETLNNVPFEVLVQEAHPLEAIRSAAREIQPDLLIVGSRGHTRFERLLLGSITENLFREASYPTLIVKTQMAQAGVRRLLCPVNLSEVAMDCARYSSALAEQVGADLFMLQAVEEPNADLEAAKDRLCRWHREDGQVHAQVAEIVRHGDPVKETIHESQRHGIDLVVIGARHRRIMDFLTIGRTTEHIVRFSPVSVLVVPGSGKEEG